MPQKLIFRGVFMRYFDVRRDESGQFTRLYLTADLSDTVCQAMGWTAGEGTKSGKLKGSLVATHMELIPSVREHSKESLDLDVNEVSDFEFTEVKDDDGEGSHMELRFVVRSAQEAAESLAGAYWRKIGKGLAQLCVAYEKQEGLPLHAPAEDDRQQTLPGAEGGEEVKAEEEPAGAEVTPIAGPALASKAEVERSSSRRGDVPGSAADRLHRALDSHRAQKATVHRGQGRAAKGRGKSGD